MGKPLIQPSAARVLLRADPATVAELHAVVEACDNVAVVRTMEPDIALVELLATPDTLPEAMALARVIERRLGAEIISPPPGARPPRR